MIASYGLGRWQSSSAAAARTSRPTADAALLSADDGPGSEALLPHTFDEAKALAKTLGDAPSPDALAQALATLDSWIVQPQDDQPFLEYKLSVAKQLRQLVRENVLALQDRSLAAETSREAHELHAQAGRILALYPMSDDQDVTHAAHDLMARQAALAGRLETLGRQRYNRWAIDQIELALKDFNQNSSWWKSGKVKSVLMDSLVSDVGEIDPNLLDPEVAALYSQAIERTSQSISEDDRLDLARRLSDPKLSRKTLGDL
jgi:hypothetical protein